MKAIGDYLGNMDKVIAASTTDKGKRFAEEIKKKIELKRELGHEEFLKYCHDVNNKRGKDTSIHYTKETVVIKRRDGYEIKIPQHTAFSYPLVEMEFDRLSQKGNMTKVKVMVTREQAKREKERLLKPDTNQITIPLQKDEVPDWVK